MKYVAFAERKFKKRGTITKHSFATDTTAETDTATDTDIDTHTDANTVTVTAVAAFVALVAAIEGVALAVGVGVGLGVATIPPPSWATAAAACRLPHTTHRPPPTACIGIRICTRTHIFEIHKSCG